MTAYLSLLFQFKCDCEALKGFAALVDFEHLVPRDAKLGRAAVLFRKEIYDSGLCVRDGASGGGEESLKAFLRSYVFVSEPGEADPDPSEASDLDLRCAGERLTGPEGGEFLP